MPPKKKTGKKSGARTRYRNLGIPEESPVWEQIVRLQEIMEQDAHGAPVPLYVVVARAVENELASLEEEA